MPINLINEADLNKYIVDLVYNGAEITDFTAGNFKSTAYVRQRKDDIIKAMFARWAKNRLRTELLNEKYSQFFDEIKTADGHPKWVQDALVNGKVHRFLPDKVTDSFRAHVSELRDFMYSSGESYLNKVLDEAERKQVEPKINLSFLLTVNEYSTFEMALEQSRLWHEKIAKQAQNLRKDPAVYAKSIVGTKFEMQLADDMIAVKLLTPQALDFESDYMGHCVGKGSYDENVQKGKIKIYSIRDNNGVPHATLEIRDGEVYQCKGRANRAVISKYIPYIQEFVKARKLKIQHDMKNIGLIEQDGIYYAIFDLPKDKTFTVESLDLSEMGLTKLPDLSNVVIKGNFDCNNNQLTSLQGAPEKVGNFDCRNNQLTSLQGAPKEVSGDFNCSNNQLTSLRGAPEKVASFDCRENQLTSLEYAPEKVDNFDCRNNQLTSLQGAPEKVDTFNCSDNQLTSLEYAPEKVDTFNCSDNQLTSLEYAPEKVGNFDCRNNQLTSLKGAPKEVSGGFDCDNNQLTSLKGAPKEVNLFNCGNNQLTSLEYAPEKVASFYCRNNQLTSLEYAPEKVDSFDCSNNQLTSLEYAPKEVSGNFDCSNNQLTSLEYAPKEVSGNFDCHNNQLTSLEYAPKEVSGNFDCQNNQLTSLEGAPEKVGRFDCRNNQLTSLEYAPKEVSGRFNCENNPLDTKHGRIPQSLKNKITGVSDFIKARMITNWKAAHQENKASKTHALNSWLARIFSSKKEND